MKHNSARNLSEYKFTNLCLHYKDSFEMQVATHKQRDRLFLFLIIIISAFIVQTIKAEYINATLCNYLYNKYDVKHFIDASYINVFLWLLLFGISSKYYQIVIQIERQYAYLYHLENLINSKYIGTKAFTREGETYLDSYPIFSNWIHLLYQGIFPIIVLFCIIIRIWNDFSNFYSFTPVLIIEFVAYLLVGTSTILYVGELHKEFIQKIINKIKSFL